MFDVFTHAEEQESLSQQTGFVQKTVLRKGKNPEGDGGCNSHNRSRARRGGEGTGQTVSYLNSGYLPHLLKHLVPASLQDQK